MKTKETDKKVQHLKDLLNLDNPSFPQFFLLKNKKYIPSLI